MEKGKWLVLLAACCVAACTEAKLLEPTPGTLRVTISTQGEDIDADGYALRVNGGPEHAVGINDVLTLEGAAVGDYEVELTRVATNCDVAAGTLQRVRIEAGATAVVAFEVICYGPPELEVTTRTLGDDVDSDGYTVRIDGVVVGVIGSNAAGRFSVAAGERTVALADVAPNCAATTPAAQTVLVSPRGTTSAHFALTCHATIEVPSIAGQIAFSSTRSGGSDIYLLRGTQATRLTDHPAWDGSPALSPDGTKLLFGTDRDGNEEIYVMNVDGTDQRNLTRHPGADQRPSWSPDGQRILFVSDRDGALDIFMMNADGSAAVNLTRHPAIDRPAVWSPDGTRIAFSSARTGDFEIFVMNADGSNLINLTNDPGRVDFAPAWSPDGTRIAYTSHTVGGDGQNDIRVMNADGSAQINLTTTPADDRWPSWSPDGRQLVFASNRSGSYDLYVMNADGSGQVNLTRLPESSDVPGWPQAWGLRPQQ